MKTTNTAKLKNVLLPGKVYRREMLGPYSKTVDRSLKSLEREGAVKKLSQGLYYRPKKSTFGFLPPNEKDLVHCFLKDKDFLLVSWNDYTGLGMGLTQLYNTTVVYNKKRHVKVKLGGRNFNFRINLKGFPKKIDKEFLVVDMLNNLKLLSEDEKAIKEKVNQNLKNLDKKKLLEYVRKYGKISVRHFFKVSGY